MQRFISVDPIEWESEDFNWYRYVGNDPVNYFDPSGLDINATQFVRDVFVNVATAGGGAASNALGGLTTVLQDPQTTMLKAMFIAILLVAGLYILTSIAVLGNLPLPEIIKTKDYALAQAAEPIFGALGFKIIAATALLATASAINATLYAVADIGYTMAKEGNLPKIYEYNVHNSYEGLIVSTVLVIPMILFFNLSQITTVAAIVMLLVQGTTHVAHLNLIKKTGANKTIIICAIIAMFAIAAITLYSTYATMPEIAYYLIASFAFALSIEFILRYFNKRTITKQTSSL
jgi:amino acid transporter